MKRNLTETQISLDGLRYRKKVSGSPFGMTGIMGATLGCYKCGKHKPRVQGSFKKLGAQTLFICGDCKPVSFEANTKRK